MKQKVVVIFMLKQPPLPYHWATDSALPQPDERIGFLHTPPNQRSSARCQMDAVWAYFIGMPFGQLCPEMAGTRLTQSLATVGILLTRYQALFDYDNRALPTMNLFNSP